MQPGAFEPELVAAMAEALEAACKTLHDTHLSEAAREDIARRIIAAARFGERDPVRLRAAALGWPVKQDQPPFIAEATARRRG